MRLIHTTLFAAIAALGLTACNKPADTTPEATGGRSHRVPADR